MMKCITFILALILWTTCAQAQQTWQLGANGWTVLNGTPTTSGTCGGATATSNGTCVAYVTSAGNDSTCQTQPLPVTSYPSLPCATGHKAQTLMRAGSPDWGLFHRGETFPTGVNTVNGAWVAGSGRSANEPMLLGGYGTGPNPLFNTGGVDSNCFSTTHSNGQYLAIQGIDCYSDYVDPASPTYAGTTQLGDMSSTSPIIANIASTAAIQVGYVAWGSGINGLTVTAVTANSVTLNGNPQFTATQRPIQFNRLLTTGGGFAFDTSGMNFLLMEGIKCRFCSFAIGNADTLTPNLQLIIRRNTILDSYGKIPGGANGIFIDNNISTTGSILIEENVVDHNGYNTSVWGAGGNTFSHNFYIHNDQPPTTFRNNITMEASATGAQVRNGGTITGNLFLRNPICCTANSAPVQFNTTLFDQNVTADGTDIIVGVRAATAATAAGNSVVSIDGVLTLGNYNFAGLRVADVTNPSAISSSAKVQSGTLTATGVTLTVPVSAPGIAIGDQLVFYAAYAQGLVLGPSGSFQPAAGPVSGFYPSGTTTWTFNNPLLPTWIVPGMNVAVFQVPGAFTGGQTTVASVAPDGSSMTTTGASLISLAGNEQSIFVIWTTGDTSHFPVATIGPNNVYTGNSSFDPTSTGSFAYAPQDHTQATLGNGNYYYNWNSNPALNIQDFSTLGTNQETPTLNVAGSTACPNATIESYDALIGGPGTAADFIAQERLQSFTNWNPLYTAKIVTSYIRGNIAVGNCAP
jgi:hypothetical protein